MNGEPTNALLSTRMSGWLLAYHCNNRMECVKVVELEIVMVCIALTSTHYGIFGTILAGNAF